MSYKIFTDLTNIIKDYYLPPFNDLITTEPDPFLELIGHSEVPTGGSIKGGARHGINGGFGMGTEATGTPTAFPQGYKGLSTIVKDMYCDIGISHKTITLGNGGESSIFDAARDEIEGAFNAAKWNTARMCYGNGVGKLGSFASALNADTSIVLDDVSKVIEGLAIDIYNVNGATITKDAESPKRITNVDVDTLTITIDSEVTTTHGGFITVQNSYNAELTGLGAIFDTVNVPVLFGITRSGNEWINPRSYDAGNDLTTVLLYDMIKEAEDRKNTKIDILLMGNDAFRAWFQYMESTHYAIQSNSLEFKSGATGFKLVVGNRTISIINAKFVPTGEAWGVQKSMWKFHSTKFDFAETNTGGMFTLVPGTHNYRGLLAAYGEFMCQNPGGCIRIYNCGVAAIVRATGITISDATKALSTDGATAQLTAAVAPATSTNTQVRWYSSDATKATVTATGLVTAIADGSAVIVAVAVDGGYMAQCIVTCTNQV